MASQSRNDCRPGADRWSVRVSSHPQPPPPPQLVSNLPCEYCIHNKKNDVQHACVPSKVPNTCAITQQIFTYSSRLRYRQWIDSIPNTPSTTTKDRGRTRLPRPRPPYPQHTTLLRHSQDLRLLLSKAYEVPEKGGLHSAVDALGQVLDLPTDRYLTTALYAVITCVKTRILLRMNDYVQDRKASNYAADATNALRSSAGEREKNSAM
jgi:hypothetical protein